MRASTIVKCMRRILGASVKSFNMGQVTNSAADGFSNIGSRILRAMDAENARRSAFSGPSRFARQRDGALPAPPSLLYMTKRPRLRQVEVRSALRLSRSRAIAWGKDREESCCD